MANFADQQVDSLLRGHRAQMEAEREDDAGAAVHAPEQSSDALLRRVVEAMIPENHLPIEGVALNPEAGFKLLPVGPVALRHELLQPVAGDELVKDRGVREAGIVAAHAHHALLKRHSVGWIADADDVAAGEERIYKLALGRHHLHSICLFGELGYGDQIVLLGELDALDGQIMNQLRLLARLHIRILHFFQRLAPIVSIAHIAAGANHLLLAPCHLLPGHGDQLFRRVGDHLIV